jgi:hypothetical protein
MRYSHCRSQHHHSRRRRRDCALGRRHILDEHGSGPGGSIRALIATGGVNQKTAGYSILNGATALGIGSELINPEGLPVMQEEQIRELARRYLKIVKAARAQKEAGDPMAYRIVMAVCLSVLGTIRPLSAAEGVYENGPKQSFEVTNTQRLPFAPGGAIRLNSSYGYLTVEGWDEPEVEITVIKSTDSFYEPSRQPRAEQPFPQVRVAAERRSDNELVISTMVSGRHRFLPRAEHGVTVEYKIHVPRDSRLVVHHDHGYVWVSDVTGDLDLRSHTGDMIVMLPGPGPYSIDARTRLGSVSSDITGKSLSRLSQLLVGSHFDYASQAPQRRIYLRMGRGSIEVLRDLPDRPVEKR